MIEHDVIPITKITSLSCRNLPYHPKLLTIDFGPGINVINGRLSAFSRNEIIELIDCALSPDLRASSFVLKNNCLIELKFIADNKNHFIRRIMEGGRTIDLHIYVGEMEERIFLRGGEAVKYLCKIKYIDGYSTKLKFSPNRNQNKQISGKVQTILRKYSTELNELFQFTIDWVIVRPNHKQRRKDAHRHFLNILMMIDDSINTDKNKVLHIEDFEDKRLSDLLFKMLKEFIVGTKIQLIVQTKHLLDKENILIFNADDITPIRRKNQGMIFKNRVKVNLWNQYMK